MKRVQRGDDTIGLFIGNHDFAARSIMIYGLGAPGQTDPRVAIEISNKQTDRIIIDHDRSGGKVVIYYDLWFRGSRSNGSESSDRDFAMRNTGCPSCPVEVMDKVVFRRRKSMKARHLAGSGECAMCFLN